MTGRRAVLRTLGGLTVLGGAAGLYGAWIEPTWRLRIAEYRLRPAAWPAGRTLTVAALSDFHGGEPYMPPERVAEVVEATNALRPDLIVLLGDIPAAGRFVRRPVPPAETIAVLRGLHAPHGVHTVLGNHDWWDDAYMERFRRWPPRVVRTLTDSGLSVLHNSAVKTGWRGAEFWVAGVGSLWAFREGEGRFLGADDLPRTLAAVTDRDPVILLCHEPDIFPQVPARVALTICGHTHGGQVRLFGYSPLVPSAFGNRYAHGHVVEGGREMVVSGGVGVSVAPVRFGVPPEITLIRLGAA